MTERFKWFFIGSIPLLYPEKSIAKQMKVELWLDSESIANEFGLKTQEQVTNEKRRQYVV